MKLLEACAGLRMSIRLLLNVTVSLEYIGLVIPDTTIDERSFRNPDLSYHVMTPLFASNTRLLESLASSQSIQPGMSSGIRGARAKVPGSVNVVFNTGDANVLVLERPHLVKRYTSILDISSHVNARLYVITSRNPWAAGPSVVNPTVLDVVLRSVL